MRHGRTTKSRRIDGYKRHVLTDLDTDLDTDLVPAVGLTAANLPKAQVADQIADQITADLDAQHTTLAELNIDRASLSSSLVPAAWSATATPICRSSARRSRSAPWWPLRQDRVHHRPRPEIDPLSRRLSNLVHLGQGGSLRWQHHASTQPS